MKAKHAYAALALTALLVLCAAPAAQATDFGAKGYYWYPKLSGSLQVGSPGNSGTSLDLQDDLDYNQEGAPGGMLFLKAGKHNLSASYFQLNFESDVTLGREVVFAGSTFAKGTKAKSELTWGMADLQYGYDIVDIQPFLAGMTVTLFGRIKFLDAKSKLEGGGQVAQSTTQPAIPMPGVSAKVNILSDLVSADVSLAGIGYSSNTILDGYAELSVSPLPFIGIHAGWRYMKLKVDFDETVTDMDFSGPYGYLSFTF